MSFLNPEAVEDKLRQMEAEMKRFEKELSSGSSASSVVPGALIGPFQTGPTIPAPPNLSLGFLPHQLRPRAMAPPHPMMMLPPPPPMGMPRPTVPGVTSGRPPLPPPPMGFPPHSFGLPNIKQNPKLLPMPGSVGGGSSASESDKPKSTAPATNAAVIEAAPTLYTSAKSQSSAGTTAAHVGGKNEQSPAFGVSHSSEPKKKKTKKEKEAEQPGQDIEPPPPSSIPIPPSAPPLLDPMAMFAAGVKPGPSGVFGMHPFAAAAAAAAEAAAEAEKQSKKKQKKLLRVAGGVIWEDPSLQEWDPSDFRIFCGDLGNEVSDELLAKAFRAYPSFQKAKVIRDKRTNKTKGYGFVSFKDPVDFSRALRDMDGKYVGNRPIKLRRSEWKDRNIDFVRKKSKERQKLGLRT